MGLLFVYGLSTSSGTVAFQTLVQRAVPAEVRGRAFARLDAVWQSGRLASIAAGGLLATRFGVRAVFLVGGGMLLFVGVMAFTLLPGLERSAAD